MITMRDRFVPAVRSVNMADVVRSARVVGSASRRIRTTVGKRVLVDVAFMHVMEMPVVQVVDVPIVFDLRVSAAVAVCVGVPLVLLASHRFLRCPGLWRGATNPANPVA